MSDQHKTYGIYEKYFKRPLDIFCALLTIIVFSWLYIILAILVRINLGSPVLFRQKRPGKDGKIFELYKFRSMSNARNDKGELLPDAERLTKFGRLLRSTSLDELPEVFNILLGQMSIVGPRPLAVQYLSFYNKEEMHRHDVRPGLSGLAQVKGRNDLQWEERFAYDLKYVNKITFIGDLSIILLTIKKAFKSEGITIRGTGKITDFDEYRKSQMEGKYDFKG